MPERAFLGTWGSIIWRGDTGSSESHEVNTALGETEGAAQLFAFVTAIKPYSLCNLTFKFHIAKYDEDIGAPGVAADVRQIVVVYFRDPDDLLVKHFSYPAPRPTDIEDVGYGKRLKQPAVEAVVALWSSLKGKTFQPLYGVYYERLT